MELFPLYLLAISYQHPDPLWDVSVSQLYKFNASLVLTWCSLAPLSAPNRLAHWAHISAYGHSGQKDLKIRLEKKKLTIKITTKFLSQDRSTDSKSLAAFTWQSFASMDRHFSCAENCIQRYLLGEIYIFLKNISKDSQIPLVTLLSSSHTERSQLAFEPPLTGCIHYLSLRTASHTLSFPVGTTICMRGLL